MSRSYEMGLALLVATAAGTLNAFASKLVQQGRSVLWLVAASVLAIGSWAWMARRSPWNLLISSLAWDIVYNVAFLGIMIFWLREARNPWQVVGAGLITVGLIALRG